MTKEGTVLLSVSSTMHLMVDGLCLCCLYLTVSSFTTNGILSVFLLYNILAFMSQPLTGMMVDRLTHRHWLRLWSLVLLTLGVLVSLSLPLWTFSSSLCLIVAVLLGIGNSLFHVWGGKQVVLTTNNDIRALGVFVSTGAMGLAVSVVFFSWSLLCFFLLALCLLASTYLHVEGRMKEGVLQGETSNIRHFSLTFVLLSVVAIMVIVGFRSYVGETFSSPLVKNSTVILLIGFVSMMGKMLGGWLVRWMGMITAVIVILLTVACCIAFRHVDNVILLLGLLAINCTMPITLYLSNVVLKGHEGLSFGLLAAALIPGYLLAAL